MENQIRITSKNVNLEIIAKLLNSVARKYNCRVRYIQGENRLRFMGDEAYCKHIAEELLGHFVPHGAGRPVPVNTREWRQIKSGWKSKQRVR